MRESSGGSRFSPGSTTSLNTAKGSADGNSYFLPRLPEPATENNRSGLYGLNCSNKSVMRSIMCSQHPSLKA